MEEHQEQHEHEPSEMTHASITKKKMIGDSVFEEICFSFTGANEKIVIENMEKLMNMSLDYDNKMDEKNNKINSRR
jgi:hypothetical protein